MGKEDVSIDKVHEKGSAREDGHKEKDKVRDKDRDKHREKRKERAQEKGKERVKPIPPPPPPREKEKEKSKDKSKDKEKVRDKDTEKEKERVKEKDKERREREKDADRERESDKGKDHKAKVKDTDKENDKERHRDREKAKAQDERPKERDRGRDKEKDGGREREREKTREKEKDKEPQIERERERETDKERDTDRAALRDQRAKDVGKELDKGRNKEREGKQEAEARMEQAEVTAQDLKERIAKSRDERLKSQEVKKEKKAPKQDDVDDLSAWISKSRTLEERKKAEERAKAERMAKMLEEQEGGAEDDDEDFFEARRQYGARELAGLKVRHGLDKVMEGGAVVLTLKDSSILADGDINEEADELENFEIAQQKAREGAYKAAKKGPGKYEDKFNNDISGQHEILPKYDDPMLEDGVVLDAKGGVGEEARRRLQEVRERLAGTTAAEGRKETLLGGGLSVAGDYYTQEEMQMFRKPKKEKKKKLRKKDKIDYDAMEAEAIAVGLGSTDHGSRDAGVSRVERREEELKTRDAEARKAAYEHALAKATEASRALEEEAMADATMVDAKDADVDADEDFEVGAEEDDELFKALERARQVALKKQAEGPGRAGAEAVAARLAEAKKNSEEAADEATGGGLVFTDTGEFCRSLSLDEVAARKKGGREADEEEPAAPGEEMAISPPVSPVAPTLPSGWSEVGEKAEEEEPKAAKTEPQEEVEPVLAEKPVGKGLAGVLSMLQSKGELKETVEWGGRNMDKKKSKLVGIRDSTPTDSWPREIQLERRDEFGRIMTPKEAFRDLSHKFHGKFPGKMKQEKRIKQYEEELKMKSMAAGDTPLMAMEKMREEQAKIKSPFLIISGHIKPGQTSDPTSGFATVEKSIGSLTPMLGDKKVEYMLGIKRKEGGSMGPPPAKKPKSEPKSEAS